LIRASRAGRQIEPIRRHIFGTGLRWPDVCLESERDPYEIGGVAGDAKYQDVRLADIRVRAPNPIQPSQPVATCNYSEQCRAASIRCQEKKVRFNPYSITSSPFVSPVRPSTFPRQLYGSVSGSRGTRSGQGLQARNRCGRRRHVGGVWRVLCTVIDHPGQGVSFRPCVGSIAGGLCHFTPAGHWTVHADMSRRNSIVSS
jgi:hypothetical protein